MRIPKLALAIPLFLGLVACGDGTFADVSGTVDGQKFTAGSWFYGGPFIAFSSLEEECEDFAWINRGATYETGQTEDEGAPPLDSDRKVLLFTYDGDSVVAENTSLGGESAVDGRLLVVSGGGLEVHRVEGGSLNVEEVDQKKEKVTGSVNVDFEDGNIKGDFEVGYCTNLKVKY